MKFSTLTQNGRRVEGMLSFGPEHKTVDGTRRVPVGLSRYSLDMDCGESSFELNIQGQQLMTFRGTVEGYNYHPATGLIASILLSGEPEFTDLAPALNGTRVL